MASTRDGAGHDGSPASQGSGCRDLSVIAACLQDALIPLSEMVYLAGEGRFVAAFTRFRRECLADPDAAARA